MRIRWAQVRGALIRGGLGAALIVLHGGAVGCGKSAKSSAGAAPSEGAGGAGRAGASAAGNGASGSGAGTSAAGGGGSGEAGIGGSGATTGGVSGSSAGASASAGFGGQIAGAGGAAAGGGGIAGDGPDHGGESTAGGDSGGGSSCLDLCTATAPACCTPELRCMSRVPRCHIDVLEAFLTPSYEYSDYVSRVAPLSHKLMAMISDADIVAAAADPPPAPRFELHLSADASDANAYVLLHAENHPFRVTCDGEELFVGSVYTLDGAAALKIPVLHVSLESDQTVTLKLGASQGAWAGFGSSDGEAERERIDRPELRATFCIRGILGELGP